MSTTKLVTTLVIALILGFAGGFVSQLVMDDGSDLSNLSSKVDAINEQVGDLRSESSSFATTDALEDLRSQIEGLSADGGSTGSSSSDFDLSKLESDFNSLKSEVEELKSQDTSASGSGGSLKIGYVNANEAFTVFTDAVSEERSQVQTLEEEMLSLREQAIQGEITVEEYQQEIDIKQAEVLKAQLDINLSMVDKMIESTGFSNYADRLRELRNQFDPVIEELENTLTDLKNNSASPEEVSNLLSQVNNQYTQLDDLLTNLIESKIAQVTNNLADAGSYDMVFREANVLLAQNQSSIDNLTDQAKEELRKEIA